MQITTARWVAATERLVASNNEPAFFVAWNPAMPLLAVSVKSSIELCAVGSRADIDVTRTLLKSSEQSEIESCCKWVNRSTTSQDHNILTVLMSIEVEADAKECMQICWHRKGDYMASLLADSSIIIHQISKRRSHRPFDQKKKTKSSKIGISFHPSNPWFFVGSRTCVRCYDLSASQLLKTLKFGGGGVSLTSQFALHPSGDHLVIGCSDASVRWFDLELSQRPYKTLRTLHKTTLQHVEQHPTKPLLVSASNDGRIVITHARVYADLLKDPLIMPVKVLQLPRQSESSRIPKVLAAFHPQLPWLLASCSHVDTTGKFTQIRLYTDSSK